MKIAALIVAAGRGTRAKTADAVPKQYLALAGRAVLTHTADRFLAHPAITETVVVIHADDEALYRQAMADTTSPRLLSPAIGGATRQLSVLAGLRHLAPHAPDLVLIHDAARPFVDRPTLDRVIAALETRDGAIAAAPLADTLKRAGTDGSIAETLPRDNLWRAQTPQGFRFPAILVAHERAALAGRTNFTDDAAVAEWADLAVALVEGNPENIKLTTREDLQMAERALAASVPSAAAFEPRIGQGFDVHQFTTGDHVWLCGVQIPHTHKLQGHSDADAPLHALTDAILGAIGDGDIGQHFPPSDPRWKGARSALFVEDAVRRVRDRGGRLVNVDITILAEAPRIGPHREAMCREIGHMTGLAPTRVGIKATTMETLGFVGRREGLAALAVATVLLPITDI